MDNDFMTYQTLNENDASKSTGRKSGCLVPILIVIAIFIFFGLIGNACNSKSSYRSNYKPRTNSYSLNSTSSYTNKNQTATTVTQKPTYKSYTSKLITQKPTSNFSDEYNAKDYYDAEDFYEDHYDDFFDFEDAEDYLENKIIEKY